MSFFVYLQPRVDVLSGVRRLIRRQQKVFKHKLHRIRWLRSLAKASEWVRLCEEREAVYEEKPLSEKGKIKLWVRLLRRAAGINAGIADDDAAVRRTRRVHVPSDERHVGAVGPRSCSRAVWENVVRLAEDLGEVT